MAQSEAKGTAAGIAVIITSIIIGGLAYLCLSIPFLRTAAILVLIVCSIAPAFFALVMIITLGPIVQELFKRKTRRSSWALNNQSSTENKEIDPQIFFRDQAVSTIKRIVDKHIETLARRRLVLVTVDHYGIADGSAWNQEVQRFVDKVVRPELSERDVKAVAPRMNVLFQEMIEDRVRIRSDEIKADLDFSEQFTPTQFEQWCTKFLNTKGWKAITTKASGDQGADVIADKDGMRIVLQCKLYSGTVNTP